MHRYHKNKNEKKRLVEDAQRRRHNTFPGAKPQSYPQQQQQPMLAPPQKYAYYTHQPQPQPQFQPRPHSAQPYLQPQPQPQFQSQSYTIPRRPLPGPTPQFQQQIQPLQRADSMATLSRMPIANGSRYRDTSPSLPPRPELLHTQSIPQQHTNHPYHNTGFSASVPSFAVAPIGSPISQLGRGNTVDDNWETYGQPSPHVHFTPPRPSQAGDDGDDDPPPPYRP